MATLMNLSLILVLQIFLELRKVSICREQSNTACFIDERRVSMPTYR